MKRTFLVALALICLYLILPNMANALPPDPGNDPDTGVPLDGGLSILLAAGVGYAVKKIRDTRKAVYSKKNTAL